jgi:hypothetical protein
MKAILPLALVLGFCGLAGAADDKAVDPVGMWKCEYEIGGMKRTSTLTIKKDGDEFAGAMSWPDQKETKLKDLKLKDGALTFSALRKIMDNEITVEYKLTIDGDKLKGKGSTEFGGQKREFDIEGKREKDEKTDPVGTWKCEYEIGGMKRTSTLTIKKDGDEFAGTMSWPDQKETKLKDLKLKDGALTFSAVREIMDNKFNVDYKLTIDGDKLKGKGAVETGGEKREFDIEGKREKKDK